MSDISQMLLPQALWLFTRHAVRGQMSRASWSVATFHCYDIVQCVHSSSLCRSCSAILVKSSAQQSDIGYPGSFFCSLAAPSSVTFWTLRRLDATMRLVVLSSISPQLPIAIIDHKSSSDAVILESCCNLSSHKVMCFNLAGGQAGIPVLCHVFLPAFLACCPH